MRVVRDRAELDDYPSVVYAELPGNPSILIDDHRRRRRVDVDALSDGVTTVVAGIMEHVELAGVHSGDSATITPPVNLSERAVSIIEEYTVKLAEAIGVRGLINVQYVVRGDEVLVVEANPRASRTVPYLSKAVNHPLAKYAALIAAGRSLQEIGFTSKPKPRSTAKEVVLPFLSSVVCCPCWGRRCAPQARPWASTPTRTWPTTRPPWRRGNASLRQAHQPPCGSSARRWPN